VFKKKPVQLKPKHPPPAAYHSPLWAHLDEIRAWRHERVSWRAIAEKLKATYDIDLTLQAVRIFFKKATKRKEMPLGFPQPEKSAVPSTSVVQPTQNAKKRAIYEPEPQQIKDPYAP
jgi:hypothetical protein